MVGGHGKEIDCGRFYPLHAFSRVGYFIIHKNLTQILRN